MTNPLDRLRPRVTDMHDGSFRPEVMVDDGAEGGIKFGAPVAKAAKRARASWEGSPGEPLAQLRAGQLGVDHGRPAFADDGGAGDVAGREPVGDVALGDVSQPGEFRFTDYGQGGDSEFRGSGLFRTV